MDARLVEALGLILSWFSDLTLFEQFVYLFFLYSGLGIAFFFLKGIYRLVVDLERVLFRRSGWVDVRDEYENFTRRRSLYANLASITLVIALVSGYQLYSYSKIVWPAQARFLFQDFIALGSSNEGTVTQVALGDELTGWVSRIIDGDTFHLRFSGLREFPIRLHGVDAPESDQPFGKASSRALARLIAGERVTVEVVGVDRYGRVVGKVYLEDNYVNQSLVNAGMAWWYEQYAGADAELEAGESEAREQGLGLWADRGAMPPWDWRQRFNL